VDMETEYDNYYKIPEISKISSKEVELVSRDKEGYTKLRVTNLEGFKK